MRGDLVRNGLAGFFVVLAACAASAQAPAPTAPTLEGTSWQLVGFQGGDGAQLTPDDKTKYTIEFGAEGRLTARIDCNRGRGTWKSSGTSGLEFGPLALTRASARIAARSHRQALGAHPLLRDERRAPVPVAHGRRRHL